MPQKQNICDSLKNLISNRTKPHQPHSPTRTKKILFFFSPIIISVSLSALLSLFILASFGSAPSPASTGIVKTGGIVKIGTPGAEDIYIGTPENPVNVKDFSQYRGKDISHYPGK